jgi:hypothetical protein
MEDKHGHGSSLPNHVKPTIMVYIKKWLDFQVSLKRNHAERNQVKQDLPVVTQVLLLFTREYVSLNIRRVDPMAFGQDTILS